MMMRNAIVLAGTLSLLACSKDQPTQESGSTTITGATTDVVSVDEVRRTLSERKGPAALSGVTITNDDGVITLRGRVDDEATRQDMLSAARGVPNVKIVRDELQIAPRPEGRPAPGEGETVPGLMHPTKGKGASAEPGAAAMENAAAVRAHLQEAKAAPNAVLSGLTITDDGTTIHLSGAVPDKATRDALLEAAQKTPGVKAVRDDLTIEGKTLKGKTPKGKTPKGETPKGETPKGK